MFNETDPSIWRMIPTRKYTMDAHSIVQCPACHCDIQLYKTLGGELYMKIDNSWNRDEKVYQKITPHQEKDLAKKVEELEARLSRLESVPTVSEYGQPKTLGECVQHPPEYIRFDDVINLYHRNFSGREPSIAPSEYEKALHQLPRTKIPN